MEDERERLVGKSIEAFITGLELFNKPTIKYRVEGFSFFIVNAWELMLKAEMLNRNMSIYYKDNPDRTLSIDKVIEQIFPDKHGALRKNLEQIITLRNTSTHFITEDYEYIYAPLFQACVLNYVCKIKDFHNVDITQFIPENFLALSIRVYSPTAEEIAAKYTPEMAKRILSERTKINDVIAESNSNYSVPLQSRVYITKNKDKADFSVSMIKDSDTPVGILREVKDPNNLYPYTTNDVVSLVNRSLKSDNIFISKKTSTGADYESVFTTNDFQLVLKFYSIKEKSEYCYHIKIGNRYSYSAQLVDMIVSLVKRDPKNFVANLKKGIKKDNPRHM